jgi:transposase
MTRQSLLVIWERKFVTLYDSSKSLCIEESAVANAGVRGRPIEPLVLSAQERTYLERQVRRHRVARSLSERCRAILRCADGLPSKSVAAELGIHEHTVGKWRRRFLKDRCDGLLDEARPGRPRTINDDQVAAVIERTLRTTPVDATHWSIRSMAAETGFSRTTIRRMWAAFGLQPHRSQTFKLSSDPLFVDKVRDIVGLYLSRRTEPLSSASMRKARSRHLIASNRYCR